MPLNISAQVEVILREVLQLDAAQKIESTTKLKDDLGLDSMSSLTFLIALEEKIDHFQVDPDSLEMSHLETVASISEYILTQINLLNNDQSMLLDVATQSSQVAYA